MMHETLFYLSVTAAFSFAFVNGMHDGGNVIATIVCSRSMRAGRAMALAALAEFLGPLVLGTAVATTMATSILRPEALKTLSPEKLQLVVLSALIGAILWKVPSWFLGLPSSASHALVGGLVGAGYLAMGGAGIALHPIIVNVLVPLLLSPLLGFLVGALIFGTISVMFRGAPRSVGQFFASLQNVTAVILAASQGTNDAPKTMGLVALLLAFRAGNVSSEIHLPQWVVLGCAGALALGLIMGGWRIVRTVGYGICRLEPVHSFASQFTAASVVLGASVLGSPVSTTQIVSTSVMGVGAARRISAVRWSTTAGIASAWFLTLPASALLSAGCYWCCTRLLSL